MRTIHLPAPQRYILGRVPSKKKQGTRKQSSRRGSAYGSKRGTPDIQVARARKRQEQGRVQDSAAQVQAAQQRLEARIARERHTPTMGAAAGAAYTEITRHLLAGRQELAPKPAPAPSARALLRMPADRPWHGEARAPYTVWDARRMVREGYRVEQVIRRTGVGMQYLVDIPLDEEGYGIVERPVDGPPEPVETDPEMIQYTQRLVENWAKLTPEKRQELQALLS